MHRDMEALRGETYFMSSMNIEGSWSRERQAEKDAKLAAKSLRSQRISELWASKFSLAAADLRMHRSERRKTMDEQLCQLSVCRARI